MVRIAICATASAPASFSDVILRLVRNGGRMRLVAIIDNVIELRRTGA
jgi:hypothetical protein